MNTRTSTVGWIGMMLVLAFAIPVVMGSLFTAWRARVTAELPPPPVEVETPRPPPVTRPERKPLPQLSDREKRIFAFSEFVLRVPERTDVAPEEPYRLDIFKEGTGALATGARVDLDRDGKFDEVWTFSHPVRRDVSPADDENYTEHYKWEHRSWVSADEEPPG